MKDRLIIGTRGSALALAQTGMVQRSLETAFPGFVIEQKVITTTGDSHAALALHEPTAEGVGLFTKQLEAALLDGEIDVAVHSLKDLPVETPAGLTLAAILSRAPTADLLISRHEGGVEKLPAGAVVGTSSPRRALLMKARSTGLHFEPIRGNVPTRLQKVAVGTPYDATVLAAAGLDRLGYDRSDGVMNIDGRRLFVTTLDWMLPAPGQGAIAVESRDEPRVKELLSVLHDDVTARSVTAERLVLHYLGGGCHLALGALATATDQVLELKAVYVPDPESEPRYAQASASDPQSVARSVADQLLLR